jgi:hypothetical protein
MSANKETLRASKSDQELEAEVDRFERYATVCGWGVVFGVIAEYVPRIIEVSNAGTFWTLQTAKELAGGILIAIGVAGEVLFSKMASLRQVQLSARKDEKVAQLDAVAKQADLARFEIEKQLTETKIELLKLQEKMADRIISLEQANNIVDVLLPFNGQSVDVFLYGQTPEIFKLASMIRAVFHFSKWHSEQRIAIGKPLEGIIVNRMVGADLVTCAASEALASALADAKLAVLPVAQFEPGAEI